MADTPWVDLRAELAVRLAELSEEMRYRMWSSRAGRVGRALRAWLGRRRVS